MIISPKTKEALKTMLQILQLQLKDSCSRWRSLEGAFSFHFILGQAIEMV